MSSTFIHDDFLLQTKASRKLYHQFAAAMPILDYHGHLPPEQIAEDHQFADLAEIWLHGDHYKWRAMRACGAAERCCTGDASDREKFQTWAETVPQLLRNPLYHWTHMTLKRPFGISDRLLNADTAESIWEECNATLALPELSCRGILKQFDVRLVCTTDDPTDSLAAHRAIAADESFDVRVLPSWRPDKGMAAEDPSAFNAWLDRLSAAADVDIADFDSYIEALQNRHAFFHDMGCRLSDHGIETAYAEEYTAAEICVIFGRVRGGKSLSPDEVLKFKSAMLVEFGRMDHEKNWTQQYHIGALRNVNARRFETLGPDTGFDSIGDLEIARPLSRLLSRLDQTHQLARTILYNINPRDNELMATMAGSFAAESSPGKMQWGTAWWYLDQKDGMEKQMETLSQVGLLSRFVGMTTDGRSLLSFVRHDYFRRILCNLLGGDMARGLIPTDYSLVGQMVQDICYRNAARYFGFDGLDDNGIA